MKIKTILASSCFAAVSATLIIGSAGTAAAQDNIACGTDYVVRAGDSLSKIARRAYGEPGQFTLIYSANSAEIGPNPGRIEVGSALNIPCLSGTTTSTANASAIRNEVTSGQLPLPDQGTVRFVTATGWAPYMDEDQEQGGMITEIANVAMANADGNPAYQIDFINDWGAHLQPLISDHAYDFGLVWFRPNCDAVDRLGEGSQFRCNNLAWSEPLYEQIMGYYTVNDGFVANNYADLMGKTICRPIGHSTFMLEEHGLVEPNVTMANQPSDAECITAVLEGRADVAAVTPDVVAAAIEEAGATNQLTLHENLNVVLTLNAVISKTHPRRDEYLEMLNSGLITIKDSGEWFGIVRRHLTEARG